jgi:hypothetical protein
MSNELAEFIDRIKAQGDQLYLACAPAVEDHPGTFDDGEDLIIAHAVNVHCKYIEATSCLGCLDQFSCAEEVAILVVLQALRSRGDLSTMTLGVCQECAANMEGNLIEAVHGLLEERGDCRFGEVKVGADGPSTRQ